MIEFRYLEKGVDGLARAHLASALAGHLGAALIAGYCFGEEQPDLPDEVYRGLEGEMDRILKGEEGIWFDAKRAGITVAELFESFPKSKPQPEAVRRIADALADDIENLRQSGHDVIFASLAIRALTDHGQFATPERLHGLERLIRSFKGQKPGMAYLGKDKGWVNGNQVAPDPSTDFPPYQDITDMARRVVREVIVSARVHRRGFGGLWHVINHAAGLIDLAEYGYRELAHRALPAHHRHLRLWLSLPDVSNEPEIGPLPKAEHDPRTAEFWRMDRLKRDDARLTHRIKTMYGFSRLTTVVEDAEERRKGWEELRYLMA